MPPTNEVNAVLDRCSDSMDEESRYPGMSYEDGVRAAIEWMLDLEENPLPAE
jgi:hypothetical protein